MKKNRDIYGYKDTVLNNKDFLQNYYFHSLIDSNLIKLECILKYGILSKRLIERNGLIKSYTHDGNDFDSKNGKTFVSLSKLNDDICFATMFESFSLHTLTSLSIMVDRSVDVLKNGERETYFDDEVFVKDKIELKDVKGLILPRHLSEQKILDTCFLANDLTCYTRRYINALLDYIEKYFNKKINRERILNSLDKLWDIIDEYESPERWIESANDTQKLRYGLDFKDELAIIYNELWSEKIGIDNPYFIDVVKYINDSLPIYEFGTEQIVKILNKK